MAKISYKTVSANNKTVDKKWLLVDVAGQPLGRITSFIAGRLRGKHKTNYTPHVDCGDNVVVINAEKVKLTGKKMSDKQYISYTGYPGGQRFATPKELLQKHPERIIEYAVKGMLPKNRLGRVMFTNLYVYTGTEHPHAAQKPESVTP
ncbi:MAG TPA: 50S ribosomal protein L13 [Chitinophagaceae bacterium]|nr:50S ribosomal protein L13 [Chitinophagaceae bacterium]